MVEMMMNELIHEIVESIDSDGDSVVGENDVD